MREVGIGVAEARSLRLAEHASGDVEIEMRASAKSSVVEPALPLSVQLLDTILAHYPRRDFQVRMWNGTTWGAEEHPRFTLVLKHAGVLGELFLSPSELSLGEA